MTSDNADRDRKGNVMAQASTSSAAEASTGAQKSATAEPRIRCRSDFLFLEELGEGSFSTVFRVTERETSRNFAAKVCCKAQIVREKKVAQIFREKEILQLLSTAENAHPFIIQLFCTFQDRDSLYLVVTLADRKDLLRCLRKFKRFSVPQTRFVASELLSALSHIHSLRVVHRDVKLENILLSQSGHILLSDFGCTKRLPATDVKDDGNPETTTRKRRSSFVGTSFYVSPEVLNGEEVDESCDYWAFGVVIFELLAGRRPFSDVSEYLTYQRILKLLYNFDDFPPADAAEGADELVRRLLVLDKTQRWGAPAAGGAERVKAHAFFDGVRWNDLTAELSPLLEEG